jgi:zinc transporter ZupT
MLQEAGPATHADRVGFVTGLLAATSLTATLAYLVILAVLHVLPTGYNPIHHAVSDYGVGRYRSLFTVALYVSSVGVLALAFALLKGVGSPPLATRDVAYRLLIPLVRIGMTLFPTSLEGQRISRTGLLHYAFAVAAFTFTYLAISAMTPALRELDPSGWARGPLGWAQWIVGPALALVVITMLRPLRRVFGLFERLFLVATNLWFALAAALLITRLR